MIHCSRCGNMIHDEEEYCRNCGLPVQHVVRPRSLLRAVAIALLSAFIVLGSLHLFHDRFLVDMGMADHEGQKTSHDPIIGTYTEEELVDSWDYPGGVIAEYSARDEDNNPLTIYRDKDTGEIRGYTAVLPPAETVTLTLTEAQSKAEEAASHVSFHDDPTLVLTEKELVDRGTGTEKYYYFQWQAQDQATGAMLLRQIQVYVHPVSGKIIMFLANDGGEVGISTESQITRDEAVTLALKELGDLFVTAKVAEKVLFVTNSYNGQKLVWGIVLTENEPVELNLSVVAVVDASTGDILDVLR